MCAAGSLCWWIWRPSPHCGSRPQQTGGWDHRLVKEWKVSRLLPVFMNNSLGIILIMHFLSVSAPLYEQKFWLWKKFWYKSLKKVKGQQLWSLPHLVTPSPVCPLWDCLIWKTQKRGCALQIDIGREAFTMKTSVILVNAHLVNVPTSSKRCSTQPSHPETVPQKLLAPFHIISREPWDGCVLHFLKSEL